MTLQPRIHKNSSHLKFVSNPNGIFVDCPLFINVKWDFTIDFSNQIFLSVVIPAYNEERRIERTLSNVLRFLQKRYNQHEVIVVDDGSTDKTLDLLKHIQKQQRSLTILHHFPNRGKGYAVKRGMLHACGEYVLFCDADLSTPIDELEKFIPYLQNGYDIAIGSRKMEGADVKIFQSLVRRKMGQFFTLLTQRILISEISDVTCGFKCFKGSVVKDIFSNQQLHGWSFDAEILLISQKHGYQLKEIPVSWTDQPGTKVKLLRDSIRTFWGLFKILFNNFKRKYN